MRAQALDPDGKLVDDFRIVEAERQIHVLNAPSPAATASISIGETIADLAGKSFDLDARSLGILRRANQAIARNPTKASTAAATGSARPHPPAAVRAPADGPGGRESGWEILASDLREDTGSPGRGQVRGLARNRLRLRLRMARQVARCPVPEA